MLELKWHYDNLYSRTPILIIVQCLNWNGSNSGRCRNYLTLIIVQCLNWNFLIDRLPKPFPAYNRTMLELKLDTCYLLLIRTTPYNRTMLELKFVFFIPSSRTDILIIVQCLNWNSFPRTYLPKDLSYNRTMLELKFRSFYLVPIFRENLIIVQCLNWNCFILSLFLSDYLTYNRTMLELK